MSLNAGTRVGPYEVVSLLGVGGMGEVYRARDSRLGRDVALKVLPDEVATDPERLARFQREAQVLAALNHPHIAAIHGLEETTAVRALVLELVEGETLAERIARGPIPVDDALPIAKQIAEALEAAHEQGVIHRDLKPANIKITPEGVVKVLDFGLAKLSAADSAMSSLSHPAVTASPTITSPAMMTGAGTILGTAAYMAPEQAKGKPADKRSDVWAFGCVLFEMLTGKRAFEGEDVSDTLAAVLRADPDWKALPPGLAAPITVALRATLEKDRRKRPSNVAAMTFVLDHVSDLPGDVRPLEAARSTGNTAKRVAAFAAVFVIGVGATFVAIRMLTPAQTRPVVRFEIEPPEGTIFPGSNAIPRFAVSHDGERVAVEAGNLPNGPYQVWIRRLDSLVADPLRETAAAVDVSVQGMFWFPGDRLLGFFDEVNHKLKKVDLQTGAVQNIVDVASTQLGGTANADGVVLYVSTGTSGIMRVGSSGGVPSRITAVDRSRGEVSHLWPRFLPDGRHFLYLSVTGKLDEWAIHVGALDGTPPRLVVRSNGMGEFAPPDRLVFARGDSVLAQSMDMNTFQLTGEPAVIAQPALVTPQGRVGISVADNGVLVYASGSALSGGGGLPRTLVWADRTGKEGAIGTPERSYVYPRLSPDGSRIALDVRDRENDIWAWDPQRKTLTRLTFDPGLDRFPVWTPDSKRIVYASGSPSRLFSIAADGTGSPQPLTQSGSGDLLPTSISAAGTEVVFQNGAGGATGSGLNALSLTDKSVRTLVSGTGAPRNGMISPDSRWLAYESRESGRYEIYVRPYPNTDSGRWQISTDGGNRPLWARDGRELFFVAPDGTLMAVPLSQATSWASGMPERLFSRAADFNVPAINGTTYDVSPDGKRFIVLKSGPTSVAQTNRLVVVQNWDQELKRVVPAN